MHQLLLSNSSEVDILALDPYMWMDANLGITLVSGDVDVWADQGSRGNDLSAVNGINRPDYSATALNGLPTVRFDGINHYLRNPDSPGTINGATIIAVAQSVADGVSRDQYSRAVSSMLSSDWIFEAPNWGWQWYTVGGSSPSGFMQPFSPRVLSRDIPIDRGIYDIHVGGVDPIISSSRHSWVDISEFILFDYVLDTSKRFKINDQLAKKWDL